MWPGPVTGTGTWRSLGCLSTWTRNEGSLLEAAALTYVGTVPEHGRGAWLGVACNSVPLYRVDANQEPRLSLPPGVHPASRQRWRRQEARPHPGKESGWTRRPRFHKDPIRDEPYLVPFLHPLPPSLLFGWERSHDSRSGFVNDLDRLAKRKEGRIGENKTKQKIKEGRKRGGRGGDSIKDEVDQRSKSRRRTDKSKRKKEAKARRGEKDSDQRAMKGKGM